MEKTLTQEQVKKLFALCLKYEVYDYDVQIEVVDHMASSIEEQWKHDEDLGFGWALKKAFKDMGWRTFRKLESKLSRQMKRKFTRILWHYILEYFKLPKILITFAITMCLFLLFQLTDNNKLVITIYCIPISIITLFYNFKYFPQKLDINPLEGKSFMIINYLKELGTRTSILVFYPFWIVLFGTTYGLNYTNTFPLELGISFTLSLFTVFLYGYFFVLPEKIREYFFANYSEYAQ